MRYPVQSRWVSQVGHTFANRLRIEAQHAPVALSETDAELRPLEPLSTTQFTTRAVCQKERWIAVEDAVEDALTRWRAKDPSLEEPTLRCTCGFTLILY